MEKKFLFWTIVFSAILIISSYFLISKISSNQNQKVNIVYYKQSDLAKPKVKVKQFEKDIGTIKVSDEKSADFLIKNTGQKPLQLFNISSSCGCTVGKVIIDGKESEEFGMHSRSSYVGEVLPGKEAVVRVIYRPYVMPVYGAVIREVYVSTNDPENEKLVFKIKTFVK